MDIGFINAVSQRTSDALSTVQPDIRDYIAAVDAAIASGGHPWQVDDPATWSRLSEAERTKMIEDFHQDRWYRLKAAEGPVSLLDSNKSKSRDIDEDQEEPDWISQELPELLLCNSGAWFDVQDRSRLRFIMNLALRDELPPEKWWSLLGSEWWSCDNIGQYEGWLKRRFRENPILRLKMMNRRDRAVYDSLPRNLTVYRGCFPQHRRGMSWSLERKIAATFPAATIRVPSERLLSLMIVCRMTIPKTECVYLGDRHEQEIVLATYPSKIINVERS
jgi:hypothetical protein